MRALVPAVAAAVLLMTTLAASAENWADVRDPVTTGSEYARSKAICRALKGVSLPTPEIASRDGGTPPSRESCNSEALYYGIGVKPDPARALRCALRERAAPDGGRGSGSAFSGDVMLMTIYANGVGAPRDLDRAIAIACELDAAPAESDGRVNHLAALKAQHWTGHDFSFCDDVTSGYAHGVCAAHDAAVEDAKRGQRLATLTAGWSETDKHAFLALRRAEAAYAETRGADEVDMSGTARGAMSIGERQGQEAEFLDLLQGLEKGAVPASTAQQSDEADARMNAAYQRIQHATDITSWGTVTKDGIRTAQRAWLRYRDAWIAFARVRYPAIGPESLRAALTEKRTAVLETFLQ